MTLDMIKKLLDSCFLAKKITEMMPELPSGLKPRHIHILTSIAQRESAGESVRVSDVSGDLRVTMPSVTKLINELSEMQLVKKGASAADKRTATLSLTALGAQHYDTYVVEYHGRLLQEFSSLKMKDCEAMIATISALNRGISRVAGGTFDGNQD